MKPTKSNNTNEENSTQTSQSDQSKPMQGPEAASRRDVQEAEKKAQTAQQEAREAQKIAAEQTEDVRRRCEKLREEKEELREQLDRVIAAVRHVDVHLDQISATQGSITKKYTSEPIAEQTGLPEYEDLETVDMIDPNEEPEEE